MLTLVVEIIYQRQSTYIFHYKQENKRQTVLFKEKELRNVKSDITKRFQVSLLEIWNTLIPENMKKKSDLPLGHSFNSKANKWRQQVSKALHLAADCCK